MRWSASDKREFVYFSRNGGRKVFQTLWLEAMCFVMLLLAPIALPAQSNGIQPDPTPSPQTPSISLAPELPDAPSNTVKLQHGQKQRQENQSAEHQTKRMFWVVPNFAAVSANTELPALTSHDKLVLAMHDSFDYSSFVWTGIIAAQSYGLNSDPELGRGAAGYVRYYWRAFADGVSGTYFTEAFIPIISGEDPRYYTLGHGGFFHRIGYSLSRTVLTKTDSGGTSFNWSEVGGNACEAALSNLYYPPQERGGHQTLRDWGDQMESAALNNIVKEFWPDIRHKVFRLK